MTVIVKKKDGIILGYDASTFCVDNRIGKNFAVEFSFKGHPTTEFQELADVESIYVDTLCIYGSNTTEVQQ